MALARFGIAASLRCLQRACPAELYTASSRLAGLSLATEVSAASHARSASSSPLTFSLPSTSLCSAHREGAYTSSSAGGSQAHSPGCSSPLSYVQARGYKFFSPHLMQVVKVDQPGRRKLTHNQIVGRAAATLQRSVLEAKLPEGWKRRRHYIKPKYQRQNIHRAGIMKRKRSEFNYKLKWALTTMARGF